MSQSKDIVFSKNAIEAFYKYNDVSSEFDFTTGRALQNNEETLDLAEFESEHKKSQSINR